MAMFRNVMVYLGLGPDDEYDENYLYDEDNVDFEGLERRTGGTRSLEGARGGDDEDLGVGAVRPLRPVPDNGGDSSDRPFSDLRPGVPSGPTESGLRKTASGEHPSGALGSQTRNVPPESKSDMFESRSSAPEQAGHGSGAGVGSIRPSPTGSSSQHPPSGEAPNARLANALLADSGSAKSRQFKERSSFGTDDFSQPQGSRGVKPRTVVPRGFDDAKNVANEYKAGAPVVMNLREADKETGRRLLDFSSGMVYGLGGGMEKLAANVFLIIPEGLDVTAEDRRRMEERGYGR